MKWESLLRRSLDIGADYIATGHYAQICSLENGRYAVRQSVSARKDQSYALYNLTQEQLSKTLMPIGEYEKRQVREIADHAGLPVAHKPDSMEICFVPDGDYASYIEKTTGVVSEPGDFVDMQGHVLGRHRGIIHYTVGQRRGLNLALGYPAFVLCIRPETNEVVIGRSEENLSERAVIDQVNCMAEPELSESRTYLGKIRYNHAGTPVRVHRLDEERYECVFLKPQRAVTPGQALVLYDNGVVAGGGVIE